MTATTQAQAEEYLRKLKEKANGGETFGASATNGKGKQSKADGPEEWFLSDQHRQELHTESGIDPEVVKERGYETLTAPTSANSKSREYLERLRIPQWAMKGNRRWPILGIPIYDARGGLVSYQAKPKTPAVDENGRQRKYASPMRIPAKVDVHPRNRDKIVDPTVDLWITEGIKKADSLTSRGACVAALSGVFNWRNSLGELGDWENILLKGRVVNVCFDSDALTNRNVLRAMVRCVQWAKYRGAKEVYYLIVPEEVRGVKVKGADDFLVAGGTLQQLLDERTQVRPTVNTNSDQFSEARMAELLGRGR